MSCLLRPCILAAIVSAVSVIASPCHPIDNEHPLQGGDFEHGNPFIFSKDNEVGGRIVTPGYNSDHKFYSFTMVDNNLLEMYQVIRTSQVGNYRCTYNWYFDHYYETTYRNNITYVPYLRFYHDDELVGNRWPVGDWQTGDWLSGSFEFTSSESGKDTIWVDAASPQPRYGEGGGPNYLSLDNIVCSLSRAQ